MTTATDHKNNLNSSALKKKYARTLRVETIANSAGGTAEVAIVPSQVQAFSTQILSRWITHGRHRRLLRPHHGGTHTIESLTLLVSPLDMMGTYRNGSSDCNDRLWYPRP